MPKVTYIQNIHSREMKYAINIKKYVVPICHQSGYNTAEKRFFRTSFEWIDQNATFSIVNNFRYQRPFLSSYLPRLLLFYGIVLFVLKKYCRPCRVKYQENIFNVLFPPPKSFPIEKLFITIFLRGNCCIYTITIYEFMSSIFVRQLSNNVGN